MNRHLYACFCSRSEQLQRSLRPKKVPHAADLPLVLAAVLIPLVIILIFTWRSTATAATHDSNAMA